MTPEQLEKAVTALIDDNVGNWPAEKYAEFLGNLIGDLQMREEAVEGEIEGKRSCRCCGCTNEKACGFGCYWVERDLCSACKTKQASGE